MTKEEHNALMEAQDERIKMGQEAVKLNTVVIEDYRAINKRLEEQGYGGERASA